MKDDNGGNLEILNSLNCTLFCCVSENFQNYIPSFTSKNPKNLICLFIVLSCVFVLNTNTTHFIPKLLK